MKTAEKHAYFYLIKTEQWPFKYLVYKLIFISKSHLKITTHYSNNYHQ